MRLKGSLLVLLAAILALTGCSDTHANSPATLTSAQAQQLALARFNTYRHGTVTIDTAFAMNGTAVTLTGWADYRAQVAYAEVIENGAARNLLMWDQATVALKQISGTWKIPPLPQPEIDTTWGTASIDTSHSELQQVLIVILSLGADRPDNAQLVRQDGARFLRTDHTDGQTMTVYAVPPVPTAQTPTNAATPSHKTQTIDYWIDHTGAIRRAAFTLADGTDVTISLASSGGPQLRNPFGK